MSGSNYFERPAHAGSGPCGPDQAPDRRSVWGLVRSSGSSTGASIEQSKQCRKIPGDCGTAKEVNRLR